MASYTSIDAALDSAALEQLIPVGSSWKYFRGEEEPSEPLRWAQFDYNDESWEEGPTAVGYYEEDLGTRLDDMKGRYSTLYLRHTFRVEDRHRYERLVLTVGHDAGFIVYLNGKEVRRINVDLDPSWMPHDGVASGESDEERILTTPAALSAGVPVDVEIDPGLLVEGENVLAIQGLNEYKDDYSFFLSPELSGILIVRGEKYSELLERFRSTGGGKEFDEHLTYLQGRILQEANRHREAAARFSELWKREKRHPEPLLRLVECMIALEDARAANRWIHEGFSTQLKDNQELWELWHRVNLVDLGRRLPLALASLPAEVHLKDATGGDLLWVLDQVVSSGVLRINCGGGEFVDARGNTWSATRFHSGGLGYGSTFPEPMKFRRPIEGTENDFLYQTEHWFLPQYRRLPGYRIPLPPGSYRVTLHMADIYFRKAKRRIFDVLLEGKPVLERYDPVAARGFATADPHTFETEVRDGFLDIEFVKHVENPTIFAIEVEWVR